MFVDIFKIYLYIYLNAPKRIERNRGKVTHTKFSKAELFLKSLFSSLKNNHIVPYCTVSSPFETIQRKTFL